MHVLINNLTFDSTSLQDRLKAETVPMEVLPGTTLDITTWEKLWR